MGKLTFNALQQQLMTLYQAKYYTEAFELVEREQINFPDRTHDTAYWRVCMHALLGKQTEALQLLQQTLASGDWFAPDMLMHDSDLVSLQSLPEFRAMLEVCRQRLAASRRDVRSELLVRQPATPVDKLPLLMVFHGNNGNARATVEHWEGVTAQGWLLALPQSSQIVGPGAFVWDKREMGTGEAREHLTALSGKHALDPERVVLGGFSMGGGQAVWMALHQSIKASGFVVLGPYLTAAELEALPALLTNQRPAGLRGSIIVGEEDSECLEVSRKVVAIMREHNLPCELEILPNMHHSYPAGFVKYVSKGLAFITGAS